MPAGRENEGTTTLLNDVVAGLGRLLRGELMLAKAEATEGLKSAAAGLVKIGIAAIVALVGLNVLAGAAVAALAATGLGPAWAAVIVGVALLVVALVLALSGRAALTLRGLWPDRATRGLRRDAEAVRAGLSETGVRNV
ncbi:MAG TPA: phage holin family protein [Tabrizicola sp.]|nr:phage holin family protein [Tabrizicola sp.]